MNLNTLTTSNAGFESVLFMQQSPGPDVPEAFKKTVNFLQGNEVYEEGMMYYLGLMKNSMWSHWGTFIADAQALAAIFMLIFFAIKSYEMIAGDKKLEIMPLLRPFGLVMVIVWWHAFTLVLAYPTDIISSKTQAMFDDGQVQVNNLRMQRAKLMVQVADDLLKVQAETETAKQEADTWYQNAWESVKSSVKEGFAEVWNPIVELRNRMQVGLQLLVTSLVETLALWFLRICVYLIFVLQIIFTTILIILGPFAVAISILPAFRDSFSTWIARFISVNLYSGIAYLVLYVASMFQEYAMKAEISRFTELVEVSDGKMEKLAWLAGNGLISFGMVVGTFIIGALTMLTVPSISTWIVSTSGISSATSTIARGASNMTRMATRLMK